MKIVVYNIKGVVGKTSIALNLALELDCGIITNDIFSPLEVVLKEENFIKIGTANQAREDINILEDFPEVRDYINVIYDLGGKIDERATNLIERSNWVIIPTLADFIDLQVTVNFVYQIEKLTNKIIIIINNTIGEDFEKAFFELRNVINHPIYQIKKSKALPSVFLRKKPISEIVRNGGLLSYSFKPVQAQFNDIMNFINAK